MSFLNLTSYVQEHVYLNINVNYLQGCQNIMYIILMVGGGCTVYGRCHLREGGGCAVYGICRCHLTEGGGCTVDGICRCNLTEGGGCTV